MEQKPKFVTGNSKISFNHSVDHAVVWTIGQNDQKYI